MDDDDRFRNRLLAYSAVRFAGLAIFLFGIAVMYTGVLRAGGWPQVGAIIAILGIIDAFGAPRLLKKHWDKSASRDG